MTEPDRLAARMLPLPPPYPKIEVWHLVYHLAPFKKRKIRLHFHFNQLRKYSSLFNGRKILSCMTGNRFLPLSYVKGNLPDAGTWEILDAPNSPLHEGTSILPILDDLLRDSDGQAFMYAHGKGVSKEYSADAKWIENLYKYTFGSFDRINLLLTQYPIAGPFLYRDWLDHKGSLSEGWQYPGTFFAARCDVFRKMPWRQKPLESRYWMEQLPGHLFHKEHLGNVSNAIFGDIADVEAVESGVDMNAFEGTLNPGDAFWARFDAALAGKQYFSAETKVI